MKRKFDKTILDDLDAYNQSDKGKQLLEILDFFINNGDIIELVQYNSDGTETQQHILDKNTFPKFKQNWIKLFNNEKI
jgi:hypothetical protein